MFLNFELNEENLTKEEKQKLKNEIQKVSSFLDKINLELKDKVKDMNKFAENTQKNDEIRTLVLNEKSIKYLIQKFYNTKNEEEKRYIIAKIALDFISANKGIGYYLQGKYSLEDDLKLQIPKEIEKYTNEIIKYIKEVKLKELAHEKIEKSETLKQEIRSGEILGM